MALFCEMKSALYVMEKKCLARRLSLYSQEVAQHAAIAIWLASFSETSVYPQTILSTAVFVHGNTPSSF